jgi:hypothetical protein
MRQSIQDFMYIVSSSETAAPVLCLEALEHLGCPRSDLCRLANGICCPVWFNAARVGE